MIQIPLALHPPESTIPIRPARLSDVDGLHTYCWPARAFNSIYDLVLRAERSAADQRGLAVVIAGKDNIIRGYGQVMAWPTCGEISDIVVAEACRGQGYGTAIIQTLARAAQRIGINEVEIGAAMSNPRAVALYRRLGFEDSHTMMLNLGKGKEKVLFLRLVLQPQPVTEE
ncbi:MAG: GNAT family N-acetyltransferase [Anaerolineae bacterium]|nr:GNAT family N-acetyltransferase [Anaerolineae bacterium]